ncbi:MAG: hypothetical protein ABI622_05660 [Chloroflexota bacterium]
MPIFARRVGIAVGAFALAWLVAALAAAWIFGSGNILVWVLAALVGAVVYLAIPWLDERGARRGNR